MEPFSEDAPWKMLDELVLEDRPGELFNLSGFDVYLGSLFAPPMPVSVRAIRWLRRQLRRLEAWANE